MSSVEKLPKEILGELVVTTGSLTALLVSKDGHLLAEAGDISYLNSATLAALTAGMFAATQEVARIVGEPHFGVMLQQGEKRHIHISSVTDSVLLMIVFEGITRAGMIRHYARKSSVFIAKSLTHHSEPMPIAEKKIEPEIAIPTFKEYALNLIDQIFESDD